jgi:hypothetical protein
MSILSVLLLLISIFLTLQNLKLQKQISQLQTKSLPSPSPSPIIVVSPKAVGKTDCPAKRPQVCTFECILPPPYICGSDGKSYCTVCQACSNKSVAWYEMKNSPCGGQFCGGFAGALCPQGYSCKYDGSYPDAGGKCIKK